MRKVWLIALGVIASVPALAHDFWMQPRTFSAPGPSQILIALFVGHGPARDRWGVSNANVLQFKTAGPDGIVDRSSDLRVGSPGFDAIVPLTKPGSYVFLLQSTPTPSNLPFLRFNDYIAAEGITPIIEQRKRLDQQQADGREIYSRRAKAIVQIGPVDAASIARVTRPWNLELEIVPGRHPQALGPDGIMPVRVLFKRRPLPGALVKITDLDADAEPAATRRTDARGETALRIPHPGKWQMNVVWSVPLHGDPRADFQTIFSSLTFAVPAQ
ncbi:MAG: DUF4198 domain-containing protein [Novosphingobium sp.]